MGKIFIYGQIGKEVKASEVVKQIASDPGHIEVYINSPGGNVYEGIAIYNQLQKHGDVSTFIDGLAYSAASWIALAAPKNQRFMSPNAQFGIHAAMNFGGGNKDQLQAQIEVLERVDKAQIELYQSATDLSSGEIKEIMKRDQPLEFTEALALGFVSGEHTPSKIAALFNTNNNNMFKIDDLLTFRKQAESKEPVSDEIKAEVTEKVKAEHTEAETPAQALSANFTAKQDFEEYKSVTEPFMSAIIDYIKDQPKKDEIQAMIDKAANAKLVELLAQIKTNGSVPAAEETSFAEAKKEVESFEPLTMNKNFFQIKESIK